jgi:hypothetical protein
MPREDDVEQEMYEIANDYLYLHSWITWFCERICTMVYMLCLYHGK